MQIDCIDTIFLCTAKAYKRSFFKDLVSVFLFNRIFIYYFVRIKL